MATTKDTRENRKFVLIAVMRNACQGKLRWIIQCQACVIWYSDKIYMDYQRQAVEFLRFYPRRCSSCNSLAACQIRGLSCPRCVPTRTGCEVRSACLLCIVFLPWGAEKGGGLLGGIPSQQNRITLNLACFDVFLKCPQWCYWILASCKSFCFAANL